jgi:hypothetical protein
MVSRGPEERRDLSPDSSFPALLLLPAELRSSTEEETEPQLTKLILPGLVLQALKKKED